MASFKFYGETHFIMFCIEKLGLQDLEFSIVPGFRRSGHMCFTHWEMYCTIMVHQVTIDTSRSAQVHLSLYYNLSPEGT